MTARTLRDRIRGAFSNVLCSTRNYPAAVVPHLLGRDLGPLIDASTDAALAAVQTQSDADEQLDAIRRILARDWATNRGVNPDAPLADQARVRQLRAMLGMHLSGYPLPNEDRR